MTVNGQTLTQAVVNAGLAALPPETASPCANSQVDVPPFAAVFLSFGG